MKLAFRLATAIVVAAPCAAYAQSGKKVITQDVYDIWRSIQGTTLSPDGGWVAYTLSPQVGDGELVVRATRGGAEYRVARGYIGRPATLQGADSGFSAPPAQFSADGRYVLALTYAPRADFERARRSRRPADQPRASLAIVSVADGKVTTVPRVKSFRVARDGARYAAYHLEAADSAAAPRAAGDSAAARARRKEVGTTLVLRDLATGQEERIDEVTSYAFDEAGRWLTYAVSSRTAEKDGAYLRSLADGKTSALATGAGNYKLIAFDKAGTQVAFVSDRDEFTKDKPRYSLYYASLKAGGARAVVTPAEIGDSLRVADRGRLEFTKEGGAVVFGIAPLPLDSIPADSLADKAIYDLWNWKDPRLQPQQRLDAARDRDRSYTTAYLVAAKKFVRLGSDSLPQVSVSENGRYALAVTNVPYAVESMWGEGGSDVHLLDASTGARKPVATKVRFGAQLSPGANYVVWFDDGRWNSYDVKTGKKADLTGALRGVSFDQETWDTPSTPAAWGVAGWTTGDRSLLVYDRYDVWELDPAGVRAPKMVTDSVGRRQQIVFRVLNLDAEDRYIDPSAPLLLRAFDDRTKASGFYRDRLGVVAAPERIVMADRQFGTPLKARKGDMYVVTQSTVQDFPNLWAGERLDALTKISDANPQQSQYLWPSVELVSWLSGDGVQLQGLLYKPEGFDASKKYPMLVYFYEQMSQGLHTYYAPAGRNIINPTVYTSKGYLVFIPDIYYTTGYPGPSAMKSIVPGVQSLIARGIVDPKAVGISGQSWGGYQTAYIVTQTSLFAAAVPNATVSNMTSAYGGIRWESGVARPFQYEKTQSRIGGSLWEYPMRFIENSPLFWADRITTPLFFMANDADGAVPWYQGIEFFVALRRLGKEAYMVNYNGDGHNPRKRANQLDVDKKMQEFFDHKLRGAAMPSWMQYGIPYLQKGRDQLRSAATSTEGSR